MRRADRLFDVIQLLRGARRAMTAAALAEDGAGEEIVLREVYPLKSDLYERAAELRLAPDEAAGREP